MCVSLETTHSSNAHICKPVSVPAHKHVRIHTCVHSLHTQSHHLVIGQVGALKTDLQEWRRKLDSQVTSYKTEVRNTGAGISAAAGP